MVVAALDAHFYDSGLQVRRLASVGEPPFASDLLADHVGFRDELPLSPGDQIVEIARLRAGTALVTWIGLYQRSTDAVLGDRGNHAGVGVWLVDAMAIKPELLLDGLRELAKVLTSSGFERCAAAARTFAIDYLSGWIAPLRPALPGLQGWNFTASPVSATAFYRSGPVDKEESWALAAEQVNRMAVLPGPTAEHARALVLLPAGANPDPALMQLTQLKRTLANDILARLPDAVDAVRMENAGLRTTTQTREAEVRKLTSELEKVDQALDLARSELNGARQQLAESDPQLRLKGLDTRLAHLVDEQKRATSTIGEILDLVRRNEQTLAQRLDDLPRRIAQSPRATAYASEQVREATRADRSGSMELAGPRRNRDSYPDDRDDASRQRGLLPALSVDLTVVALGVIFVLILVLGYVIWKSR